MGHAGGNYANTRFSELKQINARNAHELQPVWSFSTGVLRGHEGSPLVIGDVMYLHTPFPNNVYALDLNTTARSSGNTNPSRIPTSFR